MNKIIFALLGFFPGLSLASSGVENLNLTTHWAGYLALILFVIAYVFVMIEEFTHFRKSKPVILVAGLIWAIIAGVYVSNGMPHAAEEALRHNILEYAELFLFLLVAMTYIEAMRERQVFEKLKVWLISRGFSFRQLFWLTGFLAFFISPIADNLTTALIMGAVVMAVGGGNTRFISIAFVNIVVAANAGGAFSPFGDITTLMVWQKGIVSFQQFFSLFVPSVVNYIIPAGIMHFAIRNEKPEAVEDKIAIKDGGIIITLLFLLTIATAVSFHNYLHLPPAMGMMTGLGYLMVASYFIKRRNISEEPTSQRFDVFRKIAGAEWDTLLFFFGVIVSVGGLGFIGYLALVSEAMYVQLGATYANVLVGILSAIVDNIPVMFAVLTMTPDMSLGQWLLVTLTAGVGGSLLSIGSAAGVALMGQSRGYYTFVSHIKWIWAIAIGYGASIVTHIWINSSLFDVPV
ncbi:MAG: sodium:proton antiporter NhaD [Gammaproteobacteria bacterium]|nr:sodium:proton antiporter NhaD [Gammaproteobacteria bacterium]